MRISIPAIHRGFGKKRNSDYISNGPNVACKYSKVTKRISISVSVVLLAAFALFNVGMPVYFYLCPMMSDEVPMCDLSPADADGLSYTSITPDCCAKLFVAERKTTPFLKTTEGLPDSEWECITILDDPRVNEPASLPALSHTTPSSPESPPLFLLHSALLI